jgi:hypothetical protein
MVGVISGMGAVIFFFFFYTLPLKAELYLMVTESQTRGQLLLWLRWPGTWKCILRSDEQSLTAWWERTRAARSGGGQSWATSPLGKKIVKQLRVQLIWDTVLGLGDPVYNGLGSGLIWGLKGAGTGALSRWLTLTEVRLRLRPEPERLMLESNLSCIIMLKSVHIIVIAGMLLTALIRRWTDGYRQPEQTVQPSH